MSQINTNLGWSAKDNWLVYNPGLIASIGGFGFPGYSNMPIPKGCTSDAATIQGGFVAAAFTIISSGATRTVYCATESISEDALIFIRETSTDYFIMAVALSSIPIRWAYVMSPSGSTGGQRWTTSRYQQTDFYTVTLQTYAKSRNTLISSNVPSFSDVPSALDAITLSGTNYYKLNQGYAVTGAAEWITPEGNTLKSPFLISSDANYTVFTTDGTTPASNMTVFEFAKDNMPFYMSIIGGNSDVVTTLFEYANLSQFAAALPSKVFALLAAESFSNIIVLESPDPYEEETDPSEEDGGDGEDPDDDPVEEETMPLPSVAGLGFCAIYVPSQQELLAMSSYLWNGSFDASQVIKLFSNPMDSILGLSAVPVDLVGTSEQIYLGGVALQGITMPRYYGRTAVKVDMGTVTITERYGAYLDYDPYTEFAIYVPFVGIKNLKADDIMGKTISLMYDIDILTGACVAYLRPSGGSVLYEWAGQCAQQIPVTGSNWDTIFRNAITAATTLGGALFAPASAPVLAGAVASAAVQTVSAKPRVDRSGALTGVSGWLGQLRPYIIRTTPEAYIPSNQNKFIGYPAYINVLMGTITGYNEVASVHLEGVPATGNELSEIESLLKGGVIF